MKHLRFLLILIAVAVSCGKKDGPSQPAPIVEDEYLGTVTVLFRGEYVDTENIKVTFAHSQGGKTADLTIYDIRFVPEMPVTITTTIPSVTVEMDGNILRFSGENIVPLALNGEYPQYTVTGLAGTIDDGNIDFRLNFGSIPTSYSGKISIFED